MIISIDAERPFNRSNMYLWVKTLNKMCNHKYMLNFVQRFFCIYWDNHMIFILQFVNVVYHIDLFCGYWTILHWTLWRPYTTNPQLTSYSMVKSWKHFFKIRNKTGCPLLQLLFNIRLEILSTTIRQEIKEIQIGKELKLTLFADDIILYIENPKDASPPPKKKTIRTNKWIQ